MSDTGGPRSHLPQAPPTQANWPNKSNNSFVGTATIRAIKKKEVQLLDGIPRHQKAIHVTFGFAALTHLLLMEACAREDSPAGPGPL